MKPSESVIKDKSEKTSSTKAQMRARFPGWNEDRLVEALVREQSLSLDDARRVITGVREEIINQNISEVSESLLKELIDSKVKEYKLSGALAEPREEDRFFEDPDVEMSENTLRVLERRYLKKDASGQPMEKAQHLFRRVAKEIAKIDNIYDPDKEIKPVEDEFYAMMTRFEFMPNSPTLMNAGRELGQLSACFVLPVEDSLESIFSAVKHTALIHKSGGGTGFSFSRIRPRDDMVSTSRGVASGPISFMKVFDATTEEIKQGGTRRGANMGILWVDHPDIKEFICSKEKGDELNNFNISVALTDKFMQALENNGTFETVNPRSGEPVETLSAKEIFDMIIEHAWKNGEPGIIFIDRINRDNPTPNIGRIESTNPCGEQPLLPYESCNLGSINLARVTEDGKINWDKLGQIVRSSVHFLDNVIDANRYPIDDIAEKTYANRKIGLGVMGFADMLIQLGIPYNSEEAIETAEEVMRFIKEQGYQASAELAKDRGAFPNFEGSIHDKPGQPRIRNATITTIAPTGTISIISGCSSGIEPIFAISYIRNVMDNDELAEVNPQFERTARERGFYSTELMKEIARKGTIQEILDIPEDIRRVFVTAHDITPEWHIRMQAAFQKYTDNAVSKTVNFSEGATQEDIKKVYLFAYKLGCKGVTVYRDGSRDAQVLNIEKVNRRKEEEKRKEAAAQHQLKPRPRPDTVHGSTSKVPTGCGPLYVTINEDENGQPFEVFTNMGKAGGCASSQAEAISRLISLALRAGIKTEEIVKQLKGISCPMVTWGEDGEKILSCADALAKTIEKYHSYRKDGSTQVEVKPPAGTIAPSEALVEKTEKVTVALCPECGGSVEYKEGCLTCPLCGYTRCL